MCIVLPAAHSNAVAKHTERAVLCRMVLSIAAYTTNLVRRAARANHPLSSLLCPFLLRLCDLPFLLSASKATFSQNLLLLCPDRLRFGRARYGQAAGRRARLSQNTASLADR
eukprot:982996-Rhodomonas_salina.1